MNPNYQLTFADIMSGVKSVKNTDGFPFERMPPAGSIEVTFGTGRTFEFPGDQKEFEAAKTKLQEPVRHGLEAQGTEPRRIPFAVNHRIIGDSDGASVAERRSGE